MAERSEITSVAELTELVGPVMERAAHKVRPVLDPIDMMWISRSPFLLMATSDAEGNCDVSPKGDPPGFVQVLDERTIAMPERPGNRRVDGYHNIMANPHVGLIFLVPGRNDTLRVNGRARLVRDAPYFDDMVVKGHRPVLAMEVDVEEAFYHCAKAFLRSSLWKPEEWPADDLPSRARISKALEAKGESLEALEAYYGPDYVQRLYRA
ncbi:pyridoxamine 5'-phosphate oxidase family protein [Pseudonocardia sp. TRM90224]|uniref:pyridoxamine 5'-phosphate oxidase family protein n=1 Tax=Pseudonocardia sp. TRM90224 TaxID=2812678 RepID=UPI001E40FFB1|nr:pyridoxamine 5'-phosphate oxidase family protein [Pseudonocardia sp. TRM90224]